MISDPDIFGAAKLLIDRFGRGAHVRAAERADNLLDEGDLNGAAVWRRILSAIEEMVHGRRPSDPLN